MDFRFLPIFSLFILGLLTLSDSIPLPDNNVETIETMSLDNNAEKHSLDKHQIAAPNPGPGCTIEWTTYKEIFEEESTRRECNTIYENRCTTRTREKCTPWTDNVCTTSYREKCRNWTEKKCTDSWRDECSQKTKQECNDSTRPIQVPYEEDECVTTQEKRCEKHWEEPVKGKKVWVDNPATCKYYDTTDCNVVTKYRTEQESYTKCEDVPYQHCDRVKDTTCLDVPQEKCEDEPYEDCQDVQKQRCEPESWEDCQDYPKQVCKDIHAKVPRQSTKTIPIRVCGNQKEVYDVEPNYKKSSDLDSNLDDDDLSENEKKYKNEEKYGKQKKGIDNEIAGSDIGPKTIFYSDSKEDSYLEDDTPKEDLPFMFGEK